MDEPNLNCANCYRIKADTGIKPACEKRGCHIEDIASDIEATSAADDLLAARQVLDASGLQEPYRDALLRHGLNEWPTAIMQIELQYARFKNRIAESQRVKKQRVRRKR